MKERFLLFCSTGLGDSIFCTPAIRFLRQQRPSAEIIVVVKHKIRDLFTTNPHISKLISCRNNFLAQRITRFQLKRWQPFKSVFFFHVGTEAVALTSGLDYETLHCVQNLRGLTEQARIFPVDIVHRRQWEDFSDMIALECGGTNHDFEFELPLSKSSLQTAAGFFAPFTRDTPKIGIQLGGSHLGKCWPPERYAQLASLLFDRFAGRIFLNATPSEDRLIQAFFQALPQEHHALCHRFPPGSINEFAALVARLDLMVSNDTGPLHVALSQNVPVVALKAHDLETYPYTLPRETPLRRPIFIESDTPTSGEKYQQSHRAMECISVEKVLAECDAVLRELRFSPMIPGR